MCAFEEAAVHNGNQVTPRMGNELLIAPEASASIAHVPGHCDPDHQPHTLASNFGGPPASLTQDRRSCDGGLLRPWPGCMLWESYTSSLQNSLMQGSCRPADQQVRKHQASEKRGSQKRSSQDEPGLCRRQEQHCCVSAEVIVRHRTGHRVSSSLSTQSAVFSHTKKSLAQGI